MRDEGCRIAARAAHSFILHPSAFILSSERYANRLEDLFQNCFRFFAATQRGRETRTYQDAMCENGKHQSFDVIGDAVRSFLSESQSLGRAKKRQGTTRTNTEIEHLGLARGGHDAHQVFDQGI